VESCGAGTRNVRYPTDALNAARISCNRYTRHVSPASRSNALAWFAELCSSREAIHIATAVDYQGLVDPPEANQQKPSRLLGSGTPGAGAHANCGDHSDLPRRGAARLRSRRCRRYADSARRVSGQHGGGMRPAVIRRATHAAIRSPQWNWPAASNSTTA
jgi:hypothetical protein